MIDSYSFGKIVIDGITYNSDILIYPDKVDPSWWRKEGHNICKKDIQQIIDYKPEVLIIGKGEPGFMRVPDIIKKDLKAIGIEVFVYNTENAVRKYNDIYKNMNTVAALHLTC